MSDERRKKKKDLNLQRTLLQIRFVGMFLFLSLFTKLFNSLLYFLFRLHRFR